MFLDIISIGLLALSIFKGYRKGLIVAVFSFLAFIIGLAAAMKFSAVVAEYLGSNITISQRWLPFLAFAMVFFIVLLLVQWGAKAIEKVLKLVMLGWLNRLGGIVFYLLLYFFIYSIVLFYAVQLHLIKQAGIRASVTYPFIYTIAPTAIHILAGIVPFFKNIFTDLENFFGHFSGKPHG